MKDFEAFFKQHSDAIRSVAERNTIRNENGDTVISRDDPWFYEDEWDRYYERLNANV